MARRKNRKLASLDIDQKEVCRLYQEGETLRSIAEQTGLPYKNLVYRILELNGIPIQNRLPGNRGKVLNDPKFRKKITELYESGMKCDDIAEEMGINQPDVFKYLNRFGVKLNRQPNAQRKATKFIVSITPKGITTTYSNMLNTKVAAADFVRKTIVDEDLEGDILINVSKWQRTTDA